MIDIRNLSFSYAPGAPPVLVELDLAIRAGEFVAMVGPSGVGKSTLLRVVAGLSAAQTGTVTLRPLDDPRRRPVALVFQEARLLPWRRVLANVELGLEGLPLTRAERRHRALAALALVGLEAFADRWPSALSGGQRQRIGIARALAVEPEVLLMDEPFGALDAITRHTLQDELRRIRRETGKTVLFVTHDISEAVYLADRIVLLGGTPARVVEQYDNRHGGRRDGDAVLAQVERVTSGLADTYSI